MTEPTAVGAAADLVAEIQRLLEKITPGEWDRGPYSGNNIHIITPTSEPFVARTVALVPVVHSSFAPSFETDRSEVNAQFIAAAPRLLRRCLVVIQGQRELIEEAQPHVCSALCPSVKKIGEPWKHYRLCRALSASWAPAPGEEE